MGLSLAVALAAPSIGWAGTGIWQSGGPIGYLSYPVGVSAVDPTNPSTLFGDGAKSTDGGQTWFSASLGLQGGAVTAMAIDPRIPTILYAVTNGMGVFKSLDSGGSWVAASNGLSRGGPLCTAPGTDHTRDSLVVDPITPTTLYVALCPGGLFKSIDGGTTWADITHGLLGPTNVVAIDPTRPQTLYASTGFAIYKSSDGGGAWARVSTAIATIAIVVDPKNSATVYATAFPGVVIRSTDGGLTWTTMNDNIPNHDIWALVIDPSNPATLYMGTNDAGVFRSKDSGQTWEPVTQGFAGTRRVVIGSTPPHTLYAMTYGGTLRSTDGASSWARLPDRAQSQVSSVATSGTPGGVVLAGTLNDGIFKSSDGGGTWIASSTGLTSPMAVYGLVTDPTTPATSFAATNYGVVRSTDSGTTWVAASAGLPEVPVDSLAAARTMPTTLYASGYETGGVWVYRSVDAGANWSPANAPRPLQFVWVLAADPVTPGTIYAAVVDGVFKSTDSGSTWTAASAGLPGAMRFTALVIDPATPATLYVATVGAGVFKSSTGGESWAAVNNGLNDLGVYALAIDSGNPSTLYAGTEWSGVFKSTDAGANWAAFNQGLTSGYVSALAVNSAGTTTVYAGLPGDSGVWQYRASTGTFHTVAPCRAVDTRFADGPALIAGSSRRFTLAGRCGIPADAGSVSMNVTIIAPKSPGHVRIYPGNTALPLTSSLNFESGQTRANNSISLLGAAGDLMVFAGLATDAVQVILDVNGYFQ